MGLPHLLGKRGFFFASSGEKFTSNILARARVCTNARGILQTPLPSGWFIWTACTNARGFSELRSLVVGLYGPSIARVFFFLNGSAKPIENRERTRNCGQAVCRMRKTDYKTENMFQCYIQFFSDPARTSIYKVSLLLARSKFAVVCRFFNILASWSVR